MCVNRKQIKASAVLNKKRKDPDTMRKIATLNKISKAGLQNLPDDYTIVEDINEASAVIVRSADLHSMEFPEKLLAIARAGAGVNNIPLDRCAEEGIVVFNTPGANANAVKELVIGAMLMTSRNLLDAMRWESSLTGNKEVTDVLKAVEKGKGQFAGTEIKGKTLGVIGLGAIGVLVANAAQQLGMNVMGYDPYITLTSAHALSNTIPVIKDLSILLNKSDYVSIHVPVNESTKGMIDSRRIDQMKDGCVFLNFARNTLVSEDALYEALQEGHIRRYVTDFATERFLGMDSVVSIPHLGASTSEAEDNCAVMAGDQLVDFLENGNIVNSVNFPSISMGKLNPEAACRIVILNRNLPSMIAQVTTAFSMFNINIRDMTNKSKGAYACTMMDLDEVVTEEQCKLLEQIDGIISARVITA